MLLQTLGPEVLVVNYQLNKVRITARYCVNKARPQRHCNGKCHLASQLRQTDNDDKKAPAGPVAKMKYEVLPLAALAFARPAAHRWRLPARRYPALHPARCAAGRGPAVFRPPLLPA
ncbi:hypothetical protein GCM10022407_10720 [Hymenobacter antarcticus]|uniref:Uncharacterized protein n=1 Tax=Hymenobacter antarcticus TaxID=486270 RepID=A0ABP7PIL3_9BACT